MLANFECDLHGHTNRSDGNGTPAEFIEHAAKRGMKVVAMTDHDVVPPERILTKAGEMSPEIYAKQLGVKLIPGIEISCETYIDDTHLLCFECDWKDPFFEEIHELAIHSKTEGYKELVRRLNDHGMSMTWEEVLDNDGDPITEETLQKKKIFELMARKGYVESWSEGKLFVNRTPDFVIKREKPDAVTVIKKIHELGGRVIMAHPYLVSDTVDYHGTEMTRAEYIDLLIEAGLDGIEVCYTYDKTSYGGTMTKDEIIAEVKERYKNSGLFLSGGSDYHGDQKKGVENPRDIGECGISLDEFKQWEAIKNVKDIIEENRPKLRSSVRGREAAVMLPLVYKDGEWQILFEVRSSKLKTQPGEICFPGGGIDVGENPREAAVREVCEELLIDASQIEVLGEIDGTIGPSGAPMWAFAGIVRDYKGTFSSDEVAEIFTVPLRELLEMEPTIGTVKLHIEMPEDFPAEMIPDHENYKWRGREQEIPFYPWHEYMIWGATGRILHNFLEKAKGKW